MEDMYSKMTKEDRDKLLKELEKKKDSIIKSDKSNNKLVANNIAMFPDEWGISNVKINREGNIEELELDENNKKKIRLVSNHINKIKSTTHYLLAQIPFKCKGERCPYRGCPYYFDNQVSDGDTCVIEIAEVIESYDKFMRTLKVDINNDDDYVKICLIKELIYNNILIKRAESRLSFTDILVMNTIGETKHGDVLEVEDINKAIVMRDRLIDKNLKIYEELLLTEKSKKQNKDTDLVSQLNKDLMKFMEDRNKISPVVIEQSEV